MAKTATGAPPRGEEKQCTTGQPCGFSCINESYKCFEELSEATNIFINKVSEAITLAKREKGGAGAGSASLQESEVALLTDPENQKFLTTASAKEIIDRAVTRGAKELATHGVEINDAVVDAVWGMLPAAVRTKIKNKGSVPKTDNWNPEVEGGYGPPNETRGKVLLKRFLEQNGEDAYTGEPIDLLQSDLEHIVPFGKAGKKAEDPDNYVFTSASVNQRKSDLSMQEFFDQVVVPTRDKADKDANYWKNQELKASTSQALKNALKDTIELKAADSWTEEDVNKFGNKYYYIADALGASMRFQLTRESGRVSGATVNVGIGRPLVQALADNLREKNNDKAEEIRAQMKAVAKAHTEQSAGKISKDDLNNVIAEANKVAGIEGKAKAKA